MPSEVLSLEPETERRLCEVLQDRCHSRGFHLRDGAELRLDQMDPKEKSVLDDLKKKLDPYIDFENGGAKLYEFNRNGMKGGVILKPGWDKGGPTIMLQFHMKF
ncbi:MAG: hypothetical protein IPK82_29895 [Polyangiaceae bacterium]|nr:hypothetical protein [Polyangiaceae bacterium]